MSTLELFLLVDKFDFFKFIFLILIFFTALELKDKWDGRSWTD